MASINSVMGLSWAVVGNDLLPFIPYVSIAAVDADQSSRIPTEPIEKGQLAAFNIVREPERVNVEFLFNGDYAVQVLTLAMLDKRMNSTDTCAIFTPAKIWRNMALEHYDFSRTQTSNASMLSVHASFVEIITVNLNQQKIAYSPKRETSVAKVNTGQAQTQTKPTMAQSLVKGLGKLGK